MESPLAFGRRSLRITSWRLLWWVACVLFVKTVGSVLYEYRWYFPLNFEQSAFLLGREESFNGSYRVAFYLHLFAGPISLIAATFLMVSGMQRASCFRRWHPLVGRLQLVAVVPLSFSGMVMACDTLAGPVACAAFHVLAVLTLCTCVIAAAHAVRRNFAAHRIWATRCFVLLCSPLLLRIVGGFMIVTGLDSGHVYQWNAWLSWFFPLLIYELFRARWRRTSLLQLASASV